MAKKLTPAKAKEILHDGTVHGHPITEKQRRFFGAMSNKKDGGKVRNDLKMFVTPNPNEVQMTAGPDFVGLGYSTKGRNYSPAWGGPFAMGGSLPGVGGFMYAKVGAQSNTKKTKPSANKGITVDPLGYYNPENEGKPVIIPSTDITMEGIKHPVIGVSDIGQVKKMKPGGKYKFEGNSVIEFPTAQAGITTQINKPNPPITRKPAPVKKKYNIDDEIPAVLNATSQFDEDTTFKDIVKNVAKNTGVDPKFLFSSSLQEGLNKAALKPDEISEAYKAASTKDKSMNDYPVDGFYNYGLDRFGEMAPELVKKGYLPKDFNYKSYKGKNEKNEDITTAAFHNNTDALTAKAAVIKNEKDRVLSYAKQKGVTLTPETENYFVLASYNGGFGNAQKMIDEYQQGGGQGTDFITKDQTSRKGVSKNILPRYNRLTKLNDFFEGGGEIEKLDQLTNFTDYNMEKGKSGIHIKPENRGKFNALKKKTGKSTEELTHSKNPLTRKRAIFAQNAAKWHHEDGGQIDPLFTQQTAQNGAIAISPDMYKPQADLNLGNIGIVRQNAGEEADRSADLKFLSPKTIKIRDSQRIAQERTKFATPEQIAAAKAKAQAIHDAGVDYFPQMDTIGRRTIQTNQIVKQQYGGLTQADQDINSQFYQDNQKNKIATVDQYRGDRSMEAALSLVPEKLPIATPDKEVSKGYSGPNPFLLGLTVADKLIKEKPPTRQYVRPEDKPYYNPQAYGTGSQAIMDKGGFLAGKEVYISGSGIKFQGGGKLEPTANEKQYKAAKDTYYKMLTKEGKNEKMTKDDLRLYQESHDLMTTNARFYEAGKQWNLNPIKDATFQIGNTVRSNVNQLLDTHYSHGGEIMNVADLDNPIAFSGGKISGYEQGGELELFDPKTGAKPISSNIFSNPIVEFKGPSHEEKNSIGSKGIPMAYQGNEVEVYGGEPGFKSMNGNFVMAGKLKDEHTGLLFENALKRIAEKENKATTQLNRGVQFVNYSDTNDPFERLKFNTGKAKAMGAKQKLSALTVEKEALAQRQQQKLDLAAAMGVEPTELFKAQRGRTISKRRITPQEDVPFVPNLQYKAPPLKVDEYTPNRTPVTIPDTVTGQPSEPQYQPPSDSGLYVPNRDIASDAEPLNPLNLIPEMYALATNHRQPVKAQKYVPELAQAYEVSFQDALNRNASTFRAGEQAVTGNPAALSILNAQKYDADTQVAAQEFRTNQEIQANVVNQNRSLQNEAQRFNLGVNDQQYVRQEQADSATRRMNLDILSSVSDKYLKSEADQNLLKTYENLYDYRYGKDYKAKYAGPDAHFDIPTIGATNPETGRPWTQAEVDNYEKMVRVREIERTPMRGLRETTTQTTKNPRKRSNYGISVTRQFKSHKG